MKTTRMNRHPFVSIFTLMLLAVGVPGILLTSLFLVGCGDEDVPEALVDNEEEVPLLIYWTDDDKIQRANLDGSNVENLVTQGLVDPEGIALDVAGGKMY